MPPSAKQYYQASILDFLRQDEHSIIGSLVSHSATDELLQKQAWQEQITILQRELRGLTGEIFFEFVIPRMGKRVDVILNIQSIIFVIEFKVGADRPESNAILQVEDYGRDLQNFHEGSHSKYLFPILVPTEFHQEITQPPRFRPGEKLAEPLTLCSFQLKDFIASVVADYGEQHDYAWSKTGYKPTPTIIEAARTLYRGHSVDEITRSESGAQNLSHTCSAVLDAIEQSRREHRKSIIFVTGVPGSGKTLAGIQIASASRTQSGKEDDGVFLTGNGPLADVLREALARDESDSTGTKKTDSLRKAKAFIQNIHHFRDEYIQTNAAPHERVVVFDEAQRAWNREQASAFMSQKRGIRDFCQSEPEFLLSIMDRHNDWCSVICLIGDGQEINKGEAGIEEWLNGLLSAQNYWAIHFPEGFEKGRTSTYLQQCETKGHKLSRANTLHLATSIRSFRAEHVSNFIAHVLDNKPEQAAHTLSRLNQYPIYLTRDLAAAKAWLKLKRRGSERIGLVASSKAHRLRPNGIFVKAAIDVENWFLADHNDVRSSHYLEETASEFDVQGLELDWVGMCWDGNLRRREDTWDHTIFKGSKYQKINKQADKEFLLNSYRVLLTRARQGMVIYVPSGDLADPTASPSIYDPIADYLLSCGIQKL